MKTFANLVETIVKPLTKSDLTTLPVEDITPTQAVEAFKLLDFIEKQIEPRKKALRTLLLNWVEKNPTAKVNPKGSQTVVLNNFQLTREKRVATEPGTDGVKELLAKVNLKLSDAFDEVKTLQLNPSKLEFLIETGKLDKKAVDELYAVSWALKVKEPKALKEVLDSAKAGLEANFEDE